MLTFPTKAGGTWTPDAPTLAAWRARFPGVPVEAELRKALAWLEANPRRQKTDLRRFCANWLLRATPSAPPAPAPRFSAAFDCPHTPHCAARFRCWQQQQFDAYRRRQTRD